jgi:hypothetical protein
VGISVVVQMRTVAGPSRHVQCVLRGGPHTATSHCRRVHVVSAAVAEARLIAHQHLTGRSRCPFGQCVGGCAIHRPVVDCTTSPTVGMN